VAVSGSDWPYRILRPTRDPDVCTVRAWHLKLYFIAGGLMVGAVVFGFVLNPWGGAFLAALGMLPLALGLRHTVVNRRTARFDVRLPWSHLANTPIAADQIVVRRVVSTSKGTTDITYSVVVGEEDLADGMGEDDAATLARELREFLTPRS
jgi:hypothetical protein